MLYGQIVRAAGCLRVAVDGGGCCMTRRWLSQTAASLGPYKQGYRSAKPGSQHSYKYGQHGQKGKKHPYKKREVFKNGTSRDQEAAKVVVRQIRAMNRSGMITLIRDGTEEGVVRINDILKTIDLDKEGMVIVSKLRRRLGGSDVETVPTVSIVSQKQARREYSDYLSKEVTRQLRISNPALIQKQQTARSSGGDDASERSVVQISWQITQNDLDGQKRHEIVSHLKKGLRMVIIFDDKTNLSRGEHNRRANMDDLGVVETAKRAKVVTGVEQMLADVGAKFKVEGSAQDRLTFKVNALQVDKDSKEDKKKLKEQKKAERAEKLRQQTLKKQQQMEEIKMMSVD